MEKDSCMLRQARTADYMAWNPGRLCSSSLEWFGVKALEVRLDTKPIATQVSSVVTTAKVNSTMIINIHSQTLVALLSHRLKMSYEY